MQTYFAFDDSFSRWEEEEDLQYKVSEKCASQEGKLRGIKTGGKTGLRK